MNFHSLSFKRVAVHTIIEKQAGQQHASVTYDNELIRWSPEVDKLVKDRLVECAGNQGKAFEMEIRETGADSFFDICQSLSSLDDEQFLQRSRKLADLLASSQTRAKEPGGYLMVIDAVEGESEVYIVMKAEIHEALRHRRNGSTAAIELLRDVFLSPSQRLYKLGVLYKREEEELAFPSNEWGCFIYDYQFRADGTPSQYFYRTFLGLSEGRNPKIQSKRFYESTKAFIIANVEEYSQKDGLMSALKVEFTVNQDPTITPREFAEKYFTEDSVKSNFLSSVAREFPGSIVKDITLLKSELQRRKIEFAEGVVLTGPEERITDNVKIIVEQSELERVVAEGRNANGEYTYIKIKGKPYERD